MSVLRSIIEYYVPFCVLYFIGPRTLAGVSTLPLKVKASQVLDDQLYHALCDPVGYSPPGSSVHVILQERILEWVAIPFSRGSSPPRDQTWVSCSSSGFFAELQILGSPELGKPQILPLRLVRHRWLPILSFSTSRSGMRLRTYISEFPDTLVWPIGRRALKTGCGLSSAWLVLCCQHLDPEESRPSVLAVMHLSRPAFFPSWHRGHWYYKLSQVLPVFCKVWYITNG